MQGIFKFLAQEQVTFRERLRTLQGGLTQGAMFPALLCDTAKRGSLRTGRPCRHCPS